MEIIESRTKKLFCELNAGDVFAFGDSLYMKVKPLIEEAVTEGCYDETVDCIDLKTGYPFPFAQECDEFTYVEVFPNAKVVI